MHRREQEPPAAAAEIVREYGPFPEARDVAGVTYDGTRVWFAAGERIQSLDPEDGTLGPHLAVQATAGTAYDGRHFFQIAGDRIQKIDAKTGEVVSTLPTPAPAGQNSGLTWVDGTLWVGQYQRRSLTQIDAETGRVLRTVDSTRFVTGITF